MADVLGPHLCKLLQEKLYDKRKTAALEIERLVRDAMAVNNKDRVEQIIKAIVVEFAYSTVANARNGGLIGLAAVAIALGAEQLVVRLDSIVPPILACFADSDMRVRYYACESMYNVVKVARRSVLVFFNEIFDAVSRLVADPDPSVKTGTDMLDSLVKDVVCEYAEFTSIAQRTVATNLSQSISLPAHSFPPAPGSVAPPTEAFNLPRFIPLLGERIKTVNPFTRMFLLQWIKTLDSVPHLELVTYLPEFLDGLLIYLSDNNLDIRTAASNVLGEFLKEIHDCIRAQKEHGVFNVIGKRDNTGASRRISADLSLSPEKLQAQQIQRVRAYSVGERPQSLRPTSPAATAVQNDDHSLKKNPSSVSLSSTFSADSKSKPVSTTVVLDIGRIISILVPYLTPTKPPTSSSSTAGAAAPSYSASSSVASSVYTDEETQATALRWVHEFIATVHAQVMVPFAPDLAVAILPNLAHSVTPIRNLASETNVGLFRLVLDYADFGGDSGSIKDGSNISSGLTSSSIEAFDVRVAVRGLVRQFGDGSSEQTRIACMEWLIMLHRKAPKKVMDSEDIMFNSLLSLLSDTSEEVVKRDLQLLAQIAVSSDEDYFVRFLSNLLELFSVDKRLVEARGSLIIRHLCLTLNPEKMFRSFAEILEKEEDLEFASTMVQHLNLILVTAPELSDMRRRLKNLESRLLEPQTHPYLFKCLFGVLMLLPQSSAFATLRNRLNSVGSMVMLYGNSGPLGPGGSSGSTSSGVLSVSGTIGGPSVKVRSSNFSREGISLKWNDLLLHFRNVQSRHERSRRVGGSTSANNSSSVKRTTSSATGLRRRSNFTGNTSSGGGSLLRPTRQPSIPGIGSLALSSSQTTMTSSVNSGVSAATTSTAASTTAVIATAAATPSNVISAVASNVTANANVSEVAIVQNANSGSTLLVSGNSVLVSSPTSLPGKIRPQQQDSQQSSNGSINVSSFSLEVPSYEVVPATERQDSTSKSNAGATDTLGGGVGIGGNTVDTGGGIEGSALGGGDAGGGARKNASNAGSPIGSNGVLSGHTKSEVKKTTTAWGQRK
ncbi:hypothetical protein HK100_012660 [Physocladia obscura]|uniref:Vacuolar protein 14 C-terminal Fig4-binding domain-containing protein n=1 Tax=Physocladia obscura TaxID=109957 RepID=A0AAD5SZG6_9FUNG|nr:hypothetical protein HK100_012660 [Physocladia obscura]